MSEPRYPRNDLDRRCCTLLVLAWYQSTPYLPGAASAARPMAALVSYPASGGTASCDRFETFSLTAPPGRRSGARGVAANGMVDHDPEASSGAVCATASLCGGIFYERSSAGVHRRQTSTTGLVFGESGGRSAGSDGSRRVSWLRMIMAVSDTASVWRREPRGAAWRTQLSHIGPAV